MSSLNQGRNEIRFNNSGGKCLLENWVEERAVNHIDPSSNLSEESKSTSSAQVYKDGHQGLLSTEFSTPAEDKTTFRVSYKKPQGPGVPLKGRKQELLEQMLYEKVSKEVHSEFNPPQETPEYKSVTHKDFNREEFVPEKPAPTANHDYVSDQPVSFWTEHQEVVHGRTQIKARDTVFRKNSSFSKPIDEYWNEPMPYEQEIVPKM